VTFSRIHKRGLTNSTHTHHTYTLNVATLRVTLNDKQTGWVNYYNTATIAHFLKTCKTGCIYGSWHSM